jgi:hypothetical protein
MGEAASTFSCIAYKENPASIVSSTFSFEISPANIVCSRRQTESGQSLLRRTQHHECPINWARGGSRECNLPVVFTDIRRKVREGLKKALFQQRKLARKSLWTSPACRIPLTTWRPYATRAVHALRHCCIILFATEHYPMAKSQPLSTSNSANRFPSKMINMLKTDRDRDERECIYFACYWYVSSRPNHSNCAC